MPRKINSGFKKLDFALIKRNNKYYAHCAYCNHDLTNTAFARLTAHRSICKNTATTSQNLSHIDIHRAKIMVVDTATSQDLSCIDVHQEERIIRKKKFVGNTKQVSEDKEKIPHNMAFATEDYYLVPIHRLRDRDRLMDKTVPSTPPSISTSSTSRSPKRKNKKEPLNSSLDKVSDKELNELHTKLCSFFFGCNIPFNVVESDHFKNFIKALRPAYGLHLPKCKALSSTLLEKEYERCLKMSKDFISPESVLLIDSWKNTSNNTKTVVTILHNAKGPAAFLNAWDVTSVSETNDKLIDIVNESIQIAINLYNTTIYAVVSDNATSMIRMGKNVDIWHSNCSSYTANLLAKDVINEDLTRCVKDILKEFKHSLYEKALVDIGGTKIIIPCDTRWCTYRDSYKCLLKNLHYMKRLIVDDVRFKTMKTVVKEMIFDDEFIDSVKDNIELFEPICNLINFVQKHNSSLAEVTHLWLTIYFPQKFWDFQPVLERRKKMALNIYALVAYYLHPKYHDDTNETLSTEQVKNIHTFLLDILDAEGIANLRAFQVKEGIFQTLFKKHIENPILFWDMAKVYYPNLSSLALKLERIPASSAQIERVFSNWSFVHSPLRNRLEFERSRKLLHIYYTHKILDSNISDDY